MECSACVFLMKPFCWFSDLYCAIRESELFLVLLAGILALLLIINFSAGYAICQNQGSMQMERAVRTYDVSNSHTSNYDYGPTHGPHTWQTEPNNQSPINIDPRCVERVVFSTPLVWCHYDDLPLGIRLENNGRTLLLRAAFDSPTPNISGGDLLSRFEFREISFRWSWRNTGGSEHAIDYAHYPLEMQCMHVNYSSDSSSTSSRGILMISYFFEVSEENPYLDTLVQHLVMVQRAGQCAEVPPFALRYLMHAFYTRFYSYHGSLTEPPCHRGVEWFIYPMPIAIGARQLNEFRQLRDHNGARIGPNARPVQPLCDRTVKYNTFGVRSRR
ncbi:carbonic anhydrase-related protein [Scaptodrosophila lebanonensis]|uniref:Carbonic anhydrase-related protein n=1 Tax=Drosophila lebanonensis TaxID=7225 RepID=A0A6J2UGM1_DROLE|nr:carbonic anhydrase-related protein [Scaptodrosophila lebanonensis]